MLDGMNGVDVCVVVVGVEDEVVGVVIDLLEGVDVMNFVISHNEMAVSPPSIN